MSLPTISIHNARCYRVKSHIAGQERANSFFEEIQITRMSIRPGVTLTVMLAGFPYLWLHRSTSLFMFVLLNCFGEVISCCMWLAPAMPCSHIAGQYSKQARFSDFLYSHWALTAQDWVSGRLWRNFQEWKVLLRAVSTRNAMQSHCGPIEQASPVFRLSLQPLSTNSSRLSIRPALTLLDS